MVLCLWFKVIFEVNMSILKVLYHPLYGMIIMSLYGVIGYHVTLSEGHMIANHPIFLTPPDGL